MQVMTFPELLEQKYLQWQTQQGKRRTLDEFAEYLGVGRPVLSNWLTGKRNPGIESLRLLSSRLGFEVYDVLGLPRPDEDLAYISQNWQELDPSVRKSLRQQAEQNKEKNLKNESQRAHSKRKSRSTD